MKWFVSFVAVCAVTLSVHASDLRIISWNIEDATPHDKALTIAKVAKENKADILALQNVNVAPYYHARDIAEALGANWRYEVTRKAENNRQLAIFWNVDSVRLKTSKVPNAGIFEETGVQAGDARNMPAQIGYFQKGSFDFFLINVNLMDAWQRQDDKLAQAQVLHDWVKGKKLALSGTENDFIIAGTFNFGFPGESVLGDPEDNPSYSLLSGNGLLIFTMEESWKKDRSIFTYTGDWMDDNRLMDGFALSKPAWRHYVKGSSSVLRVDKTFKDMDDYEDEVSYHLPVIARFNTSFED